MLAAVIDKSQLLCGLTQEKFTFHSRFNQIGQSSTWSLRAPCFFYHPQGSSLFQVLGVLFIQLMDGKETTAQAHLFLNHTGLEVTSLYIPLVRTSHTALPTMGRTLRDAVSGWAATAQHHLIGCSARCLCHTCHLYSLSTSIALKNLNYKGSQIIAHIPYTMNLYCYRTAISVMPLHDTKLNFSCIQMFI